MIFHFIEVGLVFILILSVLVAAHELGHYIFARLFGMGVEEFSIGMGGSKPIATYFRKTYRIPLNASEADHVRALGSGEAMRKPPEALSASSALLKLESPSEDLRQDVIETPLGPVLQESTDFTFRPYPIGGFVRIKGMMPQEDGAEVKIPGGFYSKAPWKRFIVLLAGPVFSVFAGVVVTIPIFMTFGITQGNPQPIIGTVMKGAASKAGLQAYDRITSIDGQPISTFYQIVSKVQNSAGIPLHVTYERNHKSFETVLVPTMSDVPTPVLGPDLSETGEITRHAMMQAAPLESHPRLSFRDASIAALKIPLVMLNSMLGIVKHPSTAKSAVGGPGTMILATSDAVNEGFVNVVFVAAMISISVGIFNLLPVYPLDGGQMAVAIAEMLRGGRRLSIKVQNTVGVVGLATVLLLVCCVLTVDFGRLTAKPDAEPKIVSQQKIEK